ncbi:hypothetical protein TWF730_009021 [Orbilia blumenaviensis]|uniref:Peptidase S8/S53 domain-containing protein n=1 Tax=Orbilia blumenaviensis TaxID=1796055 RepID=A0AAV9UX53_9PEZI
MPLITVNSKIGTVDQYIELYFVPVASSYWKDIFIKRRVITAASNIRGVAPPRGKKSSIYPIESEHLGCLGFEIVMLAGNHEHIWKFSSEFGKGKMLKRPATLGSDVYRKLRFTKFWWHNEHDTAPWLRPGPGRQRKRDVKRPTLDAIGESIEPPPEEYKKWRPGESETQYPEQPKIVNIGPENVDTPERPETVNIDLENVDTPEPIHRPYAVLEKAAIRVSEEAGRLEENRMISHPPGIRDRRLPNIFVNYKSGGSGQVIYVVDCGNAWDHKETLLRPGTGNALQGVTKDVTYGQRIYAGSFPVDDDLWVEPEDSRALVHGARVISKIAGDITGFAPRALIIPVEVRDGRGNYAPHIFLDGLLKTFNVLTWHVIQELIKLPNVIVVTIAGNKRDGSAVDGIPGVYGKQLSWTNKLVVVGGVDAGGDYLFQRADFVKISAPATEMTVPCQWHEETREYWEEQKGLCSLASGTSFAAPLVTGVIASLLSAGIPMPYVVRYLYSKAYHRTRYGPSVLWTGIPTAKWPPEYKPSTE